MLHLQLLESAHVAQRRGGGAMTSFVVHAALITLAVQLTAVAARDVPRIREERVVMVNVEKAPEPVREEPPPPPAQTTVVAPALLPAKGFQVLTAPISIPTALPEIDLSRAVTDEADFSGRGVAGGFAKGVVGGTPTTDPTPLEGKTFLVSQVERIAELLPGGPPPRYPDALRASAIEGEVSMQFVVDTTGRVDPVSVKVLASSHDLFAESARAALAKLRFRPAEVGGRKVRMLVQQPFIFALSMETVRD
jgi:protein TonB